MPDAMIPIGTDQDAKRRPVATMAIVLLTAVAHLAALAAGRASDDATVELVMRWGLSRTAFEWWQPVTYLFMHDPGSPWHLVGNMVFLWTFGSAVEGRMRRPGFVLFYLSGGAAAGFVQIALSPAPVIGASGAVSAVAGAFIVLYPRARVSVLLLLSVVSIPAMLLVALYWRGAPRALGRLRDGRGGGGMDGLGGRVAAGMVEEPGGSPGTREGPGHGWGEGGWHGFCTWRGPGSIDEGRRLEPRGGSDS